MKPARGRSSRLSWPNPEGDPGWADSQRLKAEQLDTLLAEVELEDGLRGQPSLARVARGNNNRPSQAASGRAGRPSGCDMPKAARTVARIMSESPDDRWRFSDIRSWVPLSYPSASEKSYDVIVTRGLHYLHDRGYVTRAPDGSYRWTSRSWMGLSQLEDVVWSLREGLAHLAEIDKYQGRVDSTILEILEYANELSRLAPKTAKAIRRESVERGRRILALDLGKSDGRARAHPDFRGKTGWIQKPLVEPPRVRG